MMLVTQFVEFVKAAGDGERVALRTDRIQKIESHCTEVTSIFYEGEEIVVHGSLEEILKKVNVWFFPTPGFDPLHSGRMKLR